MTEQEYMILLNQSKISNAIKILDSVSVNHKYGVDKDIFFEAVNTLNGIRSDLHKMTTIDEQDG